MRRALCAAAAALIFAPPMLVACAPASTVDTEGRTALTSAPPATLERLVFEGYTQGSRDVEVRARRAQVDPATRKAVLEDVRISFEDEQRGAVEISAESARLDLASDDFLLEGRVSGTTGEGERFEGEQVYYEARTKKLRSDHPVRVYRHNLTLAGDGMEIDLVTRRVKIEGRVRTVVKPR